MTDNTSEQSATPSARKYRRKSGAVEAMHINDLSRERLCDYSEFVGTGVAVLASDEYYLRLFFERRGVAVFACVDDFIVKYPDGRCTTCPAALFNAIYEAV